jgi:hypothetical protein
LYAGVERAKLLYGAPIWTRELMDRRRSLQLVRRLHRTVAMRVVRGFRTISTAATAAATAAVLAGFPLQVASSEVSRDLSQYLGSARGRGGRAGADVRTRERQALFDVWHSRLDTRTGVVEAFLPHWGDWLNGGGPSLTYRVTLVLTGHGCFGEYLCRIRREATARCHHCDGGGGATPRYHSGDKNGPLVAGDNESLAGGREESERGNLLL